VQSFDRQSSSEDHIISELKSEKIRFEQNMQSIISSNVKLGPISQDQELVRFNNELEATFHEMIELVDNSQLQAVNMIGNK